MSMSFISFTCIIYIIVTNVKHILKNFSFVEVKPHKLFQPSQTRWLSLYACVKRVLGQWNALKLYFQGEHLIDNHAKNIHIKLINPIYHFYLNFLEFVLPIFTNLNLEFQSQKPKIHQIYNKMSAVYRTLLDCYIKPDYLKKHDICEIQYRNSIHYLPNDQIYLGGKCMTDLSNNIIKNNEKDGLISFINDFRLTP
ncbi:E3 SUMO-protein ligase KIAA1586-like, partial [Aphis craccivora]